MSTTAAGPLELALLAAGLAVIVVSILAALRTPYVFNRLHFLSPITSLGIPLVGIALAIQNGWGLTTAQILFTVLVLAVSGPALESATGRVAAQREGLIPKDSPK